MFPDRHHRSIQRHQRRRPMPNRHIQRSQSSQDNSSLLQVMNQFKNQNGQYDFTKISRIY